MPSYFAHSRLVVAALLAFSVVPATGCNSLLDVDNPGRVPTSALDDPAMMPILEAAALQQAQCAFVEFAGTGGMLSGEYLSANGFVNNHIWEWRGIIEIKGAPGGCNNGRATTSMGFYTPAQQARFQLDDLAKRVAGFTDAQVPTKNKILTEANAYAGYMYVLLAEGMCDMTVDGGPKMTKAEVIAIAEKRFSDAITLATTINDASLKNMALVGRARARLDVANMAGAAADATQVPSGFVRVAEFSETTPARENHLYNLTVRNDFLSAGPDYRNLTVNGVPDPRVKVTNLNRNGPDAATPMWQQQKFTGSGAVAMPIASYAEAQLIFAEATGGQAGLDAVNRVRALSNIAPLVPPDGSDFTSLVIEERRRQLFSEGQRYADMLRKNLPFTTGVNRKGQTISNLTCVPLPDVETLNNPNFKTG